MSLPKKPVASAAEQTHLIETTPYYMVIKRLCNGFSQQVDDIFGFDDTDYEDPFMLHPLDLEDVIVPALRNPATTHKILSRRVPRATEKAIKRSIGQATEEILAPAIEEWTQRIFEIGERAALEVEQLTTTPEPKRQRRHRSRKAGTENNLLIKENCTCASTPM